MRKRTYTVKNSILSVELRTELQEYVAQLDRLHDQEKKVRSLMTHEGVFDDRDRLGEATEWRPSCYLRVSFFERLHELDPPETKGKTNTD